MFINFIQRTCRLIKKNNKWFLTLITALCLLWVAYYITSWYQRPVFFTPKKPVIIYSEEEKNAAFREMSENGSTKNIGPFYEEVRAKLLAKQLGITKYKLKARDNLWKVAPRFKINIDSIIGANPYLKSLTKLRLGQELIIISAKGVLHKIKNKDTLKSIAEQYGVEEQIIINSNDLDAGMTAGHYLFIPGAAPQDMTEEMQNQQTLTRLFCSPMWSGTRGFTSYMQIRTDPFTGEKSFHEGVDIKALSSDKICSVASGKVIFSGENGGYGFMVKIKHDNGYTTLYGHNSRLFVKKGQAVKKAQIIAQAGSTGRSTGIHLHFTVWDKTGKLVDPTLLLMTTR
jgi:murein DD-endopeptidase MepM/ murein hydrolase activator NlpD